MSTSYRITIRPHGSREHRELQRSIRGNVTNISTRNISATGRSTRSAGLSYTRDKIASSPERLISIMKRPSSTPGISPSMRAAIAYASARQSRRHVSIKTTDGRQVRTRDSSGESSRSSSPDTTSDQTSKSGSVKIRRTDTDTSRPRDAPQCFQEKHERPFSSRAGTSGTRSIPISGMDSQNKLFIRPVSSPAKTQRRRQENTENTKPKSKPQKFNDVLALFVKESMDGKKEKKSVMSKKSSYQGDGDVDVQTQLVVGTERYHEVINRLCRPTVASVARATMKLIRARGPTLEEPHSMLPPRKEKFSSLNDEYISRRFLGEQKLSDEEIEEITFRLTQPSDRLPEMRKFLTRSSSDGFGIVNSYMWMCGDKLEQNQWERKSIELTRQNYSQSKLRLESKMKMLPFVKSESRFTHRAC